METPVIYFYAPQQMTVDVSVRFPAGLVTEWFPRADVTPAAQVTSATLKTPGFASSATWSNVTITPRAAGSFPTEPRSSHYYAARGTDAAPLRVGTQTEKFLFYRGVARVTLPVSAIVAPDGTATVRTEAPARSAQSCGSIAATGSWATKSEARQDRVRRWQLRRWRATSTRWRERSKPS